MTSHDLNVFKLEETLDIHKEGPQTLFAFGDVWVHPWRHSTRMSDHAYSKYYPEVTKMLNWGHNCLINNLGCTSQVRPARCHGLTELPHQLLYLPHFYHQKEKILKY